jgi:hypothetical protein
MTERPALLERRLHELDSHEPVARDEVARRHLEYRLSLALLMSAIERAERWYLSREQELISFDRRASATVSSLVREHRISPTIAWQPSA